MLKPAEESVPSVKSVVRFLISLISLVSDFRISAFDRLCHSASMKTLTVQVPEALLLQSGCSEAALASETQFLLALKFFELGRLTSGQAAEMCGTNRVDFLVAAAKAGVPAADLDGEELTKEIQNARAS
jgi:hypothetical protein